MKKTVTALACALSLGLGAYAQADECTEEMGNVVDELIKLNTSGSTAGEFDLLIGAVLAVAPATNLDEILSDEEVRVTLFAPNDAAFAATADDLGLDLTGLNDVEIINALAAELGIDGVVDVLSYHVSQGNRTSKYVVKRDGKTIRMLNQQFVEVNGLNINNSGLDAGNLDIPACNGIIHVIEDEVLVPDLSA